MMNPNMAGKSIVICAWFPLILASDVHWFVLECLPSLFVDYTSPNKD